MWKNSKDCREMKEITAKNRINKTKSWHFKKLAKLIKLWLI